MKTRGLFFICLFFFENYLGALPVDDKLPLRILRTSDSKKTVLINRGIEDGLVVGDHAKFFLTTGVVARGVVVKTAPSRSIWSLYRLVDPNEIVEEKVMNLKITEAIKLSDDPTKMFRDDELGVNPKSINLADDKNLDVTLGQGPSAKGDDAIKVKSADEKMMETSEVNFTDKTAEIWGMFHFNSLTASNSTGTQSQGTTGSKTNLDLTVGFEKYFIDNLSWYHRFSLAPFFHYMRTGTTSIDGEAITSELYGVGLEVHWHFLADPMEIKKWMLYALMMGGLGMANETMDGIASSTPSLQRGLAQFYSIGLGSKYYFSERVGLRFVLDYYVQKASYRVENHPDHTQRLSGPRVLVGLSYRF